MTTIDELIHEIQSRASTRNRLLIGVAGAPGSGKSTLAGHIVDRLGASAAVLPMDGFHLDNAELISMGWLDRKGAPETFDATGFVELVHKLRSEGEILYPTFNRELDKTIPNSGCIQSQTKIVVVEGNYLLLKRPPWDQLADLFDITIFLDVAHHELETRLIQRWLDHGLSLADAKTRAYANDMINVDFVIENSRKADLVISEPV